MFTYLKEKGNNLAETSKNLASAVGTHSSSLVDNVRASNRLSVLKDSIVDVVNKVGDDASGAEENGRGDSSLDLSTSF